MSPLILKHPRTNQEFEVRAGLVASPKERGARQVQVLSVNERDQYLSVQDLAPPNYMGFPRKQKLAFDQFQSRFTPEKYAF